MRKESRPWAAPTGVATDLAVIIPTYNEAAALPALLDDLRRQRDIALHIVVADGGSSDGTPALAARAGAQVVLAPRGRGVQMNAGTAAANAAYLLFLHADSRLEGATQLREGVEAVREASRLKPLQQGCAGHWPLRFARAQAGRERFYRYLEAKTALNRPGTINGDQGLLLSAAFFRELGSFDERLPFLEDQRIAAKIVERGQFVVLPGHLTTSARRFEAEGAYRRYTLMSLIMGLHAAGADEYFARAREVYATQPETGRLRLGPQLALVRRVLREAGVRRAATILWRAGRYTRQNSWQPFFWCDVALRRESRPLLRFHDRVIGPVTNNFVFDALVTVSMALWFLVLLPIGCALFEPRS
jgi:rSAM/selenodomain-associated transferase 2